MPQLPPGPRAPRLFQMFQWIFRPVPFLRTCDETYGDAFTLRLIGAPPVAFFSHPAAVKQIFSGNPEHLRAGQANRVSLEHILGYLSGLPRLHTISFEIRFPAGPRPENRRRDPS